MERTPIRKPPVSPLRSRTDKKYRTYGSNQLLQFGYATYTFGPPRQFGMNLRYEF